MKMKVYGKKLVCRLLVVVMVISLFPAISAVGYESQTEDGWKYEEYYGNIKITGYLGDETNVTIPSKIDGVMVTEIGDSLYLNSEITSITIPESVERIGVTWFRGLALRDCDKLQSINVDSTVVKMVFYIQKINRVCCYIQKERLERVLLYQIALNILVVLRFRIVLN
jgi:hypothetical protein